MVKLPSCIVVEDDKQFRDILAVMLEDDGWCVYSAKSIREYRNIIIQHSDVEFVLADLGLTDGLGSEIARENPYVPFIILSGRDPQEIETECAGLVVIYKPTTKDVLRRCIAMVRRRPAMHENIVKLRELTHSLTCNEEKL